MTFFLNYEVIKQLFSKCSLRCEPLQIYKGKLLLARPNIFFFLMRYSWDKHRLMYKKSKLLVYLFVINCFFSQLRQSKIVML